MDAPESSDHPPFARLHRSLPAPHIAAAVIGIALLLVAIGAWAALVKPWMLSLMGLFSWVSAEKSGMQTSSVLQFTHYTRVAFPGSIAQGIAYVALGYGLLAGEKWAWLRWKPVLLFGVAVSLVLGLFLLLSVPTSDAPAMIVAIVMHDVLPVGMVSGIAYALLAGYSPIPRDAIHRADLPVFPLHTLWSMPLVVLLGVLLLLAAAFYAFVPHNLPAVFFGGSHLLAGPDTWPESVAILALLSAISILFALLGWGLICLRPWARWGTITMLVVLALATMVVSNIRQHAEGAWGILIPAAFICLLCAREVTRGFRAPSR